MRPRRAAFCTAVVSAVTFAACYSATQAERYRSMRDALSRTASGSQSAAGEDPLRDAPTLSRAALLSLVQQRNPTLAAAHSAWEAALARYPQETALPDPTFSYTARPRSFSSDQVSPGNDFMLAQPLPFPGKLGLRGERALAEADAAAGDFDKERVRLAALASTLFDDYWLAQRAIELNESQSKLLEQAHAVAIARYAAGTGSQQDALGAETEQAMLEHRGVELESQRRIAVERIDRLLHRAVDLPLPPPPVELETEPAPQLNRPALLERALANRPELRAAQAEVRAREADVAIARREFLPDFTLRAAYETSWQEDPLKPAVGIELNLPLELGRRRAALQEADALLSRERSRLRQIEDQVRFEVASAIERLHESQHLLELSEERVLPAARNRVASARAGFASGRVSFLELVDAERSLRSAEESVFSAEAERSRRRADLSRALGDTIQPPEGSP